MYRTKKNGLIQYITDFISKTINEANSNNPD